MRSESEAMPSLARMATRLGAAHCSSRVSLMMRTQLAVFAISTSSASASAVLPAEAPLATRMLECKVIPAYNPPACMADMIRVAI